VIPCHLRDIDGYQKVGSMFDIARNNQVWESKLRPGRALFGCWIIMIMSVLIKDRSLTALLSC